MPETFAARVLVQYSAGCRSLTTKEALAALLIETYNQLGFAYVNISLMRDYDLPREVVKFAWATTYPDDWIAYYLGRDCIRFDPVALSARGDIGPFFWSDLKHCLRLTPLQASFMELAEEAGLHNGIGLPFVGSRSRQGGVALATFSPTTEHIRDLDLLWSISNLFYKRLCEIVTGPAILSVRPIDLTSRELDILNLSVRGQSDREVAAGLDITENTVNTHFRKIFKRLGVNNRVQAFVKAARQGIIDLPNPSG
jgi:DNA-binding CsgD family transcriptional regulator